METPETTEAPETEVSVTKVEVKSPTVNEEVIAKFCKAAKMLGVSPETILLLEKELKAKMEEGSESPVVESKEPTKEDKTEGEMPTKKNLLTELFK